MTMFIDQNAMLIITHVISFMNTIIVMNFLSKIPSMQIVKWMIMIGERLDNKVKRYEVDTEFNSTVCDCI